MNLFEKARNWLPGKLRDVAGVTVTYTRGATTLTGLTAIPGRTVFASNQEGGARIEFGDRDFLILADDLTLGNPAIGDRITEIGDDGESRVFEVMTPGTGDPAWRWSDTGHTMYRIHTKRKS